MRRPRPGQDWSICRLLLLLALTATAAAGLAAPASAAVSVRGDFDGDGRSDLAIGAPDDSVAGQDGAGAVNVIYGSRTEGLREEDDQQFTQRTPGVPGGPEAFDRFGATLAAGDIDGDGFADLAIGVPGESVPTGLGPNEADRGTAGQVTVLYGSGGGLSASRAQAWTQDTPGVRGRTEPGDRLGAALAIGDLDGDGRGDLAIGSPGDSVSGRDDAGAVNVLYGTRGGLTASGDQLWTQDTPGVKGVADRDDRFGAAVAAADVSENGRAELIVGVPGDDVDGRSAAGAVNVLYGRPGGVTANPDQRWTQNAPGIKGVAEAPDHFGAALAVADLDRDGAGDLAIGVPGEDVAGARAAGAVNVIYGSERGLREDPDQLWSQATPGIKGLPGPDNRFGASLAAADFSRNGAADLAIGVPGERIGGLDGAGAVSVLYGKPGRGLTERADQLWSQGDGLRGQTESGDFVGDALATGDFDGDGAFDLAIGAPGDSVAGARDAGAVDVLHGTAFGLSAGRSQLWTQGTRGIKGAVGTDRFGAALASGGR